MLQVVKAKTDIIGTQSEITVTTPVIPTKWRVFAFSRITNDPVLGDANNITAKLAIDHAGPVALEDLHPVEIEDGYYYFDLSTAEQTGAVFEIFPESSTAGVQVIGVPGRMESNATLRAIEDKTALITSDAINLVQSISEYGARVNVTSFIGEESPKTIPSGDYTSFSVKVVFERFGSVSDLAVVFDADLTKTSDSVTFNIPAEIAERTQFVKYSIRRHSNDEVLILGNWRVRHATLED
jgi:hypothetical protein